MMRALQTPSGLIGGTPYKQIAGTGDHFWALVRTTLNDNSSTTGGGLHLLDGYENKTRSLGQGGGQTEPAH